jgi:hypothetical protein
MTMTSNMKYGVLMLFAVFAISAVAMFGGAQLVDIEEAASADEEGGGGVPGGPVSVRIVAQNSLFDRRTIAASPGAQVTVTLVNNDAGVLHNIAFYTNRSASTKIAGTDPAPGVVTEELRFTAPSSPGNNFFRCDVHPDTMTGTFSVR